jgi:cytochrome c oxidase cbb3-type subunit 3
VSGDAHGIPERPRADDAPRDGIGEEDNAIPLWFNVGFYGLIAIGVCYIAYYAFLSGWSQRAQYEAEVASLEAKYAAVREANRPTTNPYHGNAEAIAMGAETWATICVACHTAEGTGLVGPSLVDPYWKYGNDDAELFATVSEGRPLGMPPWGAQLGTEKIWQVLAYMETLPRRDEPGIGSPEYEAAQAAAQATPESDAHGDVETSAPSEGEREDAEEG